MTKKEGFRQAAKAVVFTAIFLTALVMLTYMLRTNGPLKDRFVGFYAEPKNSIDVIMVGSSPVSPCYAAPQLYGETGIVMYPLSTNLQRPVAQLYLEREALKRQKPALMIFEVRMYTAVEVDMVNNMAYTRGVTDNLRYSKNRIDAINAMMDEAVAYNAWLDDTKPYTYYFDIFKYHSNYRSLVDPHQWATALYQLPDPHKGYEEQSGLEEPNVIDNPEVQEAIPIQDVQEERLLLLLEDLKKNGQQALFILTPFQETDEQAGKFLTIQRIVEENGFDYLDLNEAIDEMEIDGLTDYYDNRAHTNALGSEKVTAYLGQYLREHYDLPDRRGDAAYASWDEAYARWQSEHAQAVREILSKVEN